MKDTTYVQLAGYVLAGWIVTVMMWKDGELAAGTAAAVAFAGAGLGQFVAARQAAKNGGA